MSERESKRLKRSFLRVVDYMQNSSAMVMALDPRGRILLVNRVFEEATGYKLEEIQNEYIWDRFLPPRDARLVNGVFNGFDLHQMPSEYTGIWLTRDGTQLLIAWSNKILLGKDGELEGFVSTGIDITERKRTEEALRRSEAKFRSLIEGAMDIIAILQEDGVISFVSPSVQRILGYSPEDLIGTNIFEVLHPEHMSQYMNVLEETLSMPGFEKQYEFWVRHRDGSLRIIEAIGRNLLDDPTVQGIVINCRDITDRCRYEQAMVEKADELRDFLGIAAHELRHPITVIKGYVSTLEHYLGKIPPDSIPPMLENIDTAADRLTHIVTDLLDVSRIERGRFPVNPVMVRIKPLLEQAVEEMRTRCAGHTFVVSVGDLPGLVRVDPDRCVQLLIILLENAVNFSPINHPIEIEASLRDGELLVSVHDMGPGVPEDACNRIFDRFVQLEDMRHHSKPGLGLGLYIAREIAQAHGGRIWYEPRSGGGSIFRFSLPVEGQAGDQAGGEVRYLREAAGS